MTTADFRDDTGMTRGEFLALYATVDGGYTTPEIEEARYQHDVAHGGVPADLTASQLRDLLPRRVPTETAQGAPNADTEAQYLHVDAEANDRLSQLHAAYAAAKAESDEASARLKVITDGIKLELQNLAPEEQRIALNGTDGPPLTLVYSETWRFDSTKFKREDPETYVRFAKKSGSWTLKAVKGGGSE